MVFAWATIGHMFLLHRHECVCAIGIKYCVIGYQTNYIFPLLSLWAHDNLWAKDLSLECICAGYVKLNATHSNGWYTSLSTPSFSTNLTYCLTFDYIISGGGLYIHIRSKDYAFSGGRIWSHTGELRGRRTINIPVWSDPSQGEAQLDFIGCHEGTELSNVIFKEGNCEGIIEMECLDSEFRCRNRQRCVPIEAMCNGTSECADSSDEEPPACGEFQSSLYGLLQKTDDIIYNPS